jgi:hypothetical protein
LVQALTAGFFAAGLSEARAQWFNFFRSQPAPLPPGQSIHRLSGEVHINGEAATMQSVIKAGDTVETGRKSELIFVVNTHAMILRGESRLQIEPPAASLAGSLAIGALRLATGKLLSVSRNARMRVTTSTATIGVRGTGFYVESDPEQSYFCTCYGATEVQATHDPESRETIHTSYHDRPVYVLKDGGTGQNIRSAPVFNHSDQELALIETLVGRTTPFPASGGSYNTLNP